jgi:hypothetical protein
MWPWLGPLATSNLELECEAIRDLSPLPKAVIFAPHRGVSKLLSLINMSSKRTAAASIGSPSGRPTYTTISNVTNTAFLINRPPTYFNTELEYEYSGNSPTCIQ